MPKNQSVKQLFKLAAAGLSALVLSACAQNASLEELRHATPKGTAFQNELAKLYLTYAQVAQNDGDFDAATVFAQKGLAAAYGNDVLPESPEQWGLSGEELESYAGRRQQLMDLLGDEVKTVAPLAAAGGVFFYDCMLDQYMLAGGGAEYEYCKENWQASLGDLREARGEMIASESMPAMPVERYLVYFALDDYSLNDSAERTVKLLFNELMRQTGVPEGITIVVNGHTDTSGPDRYNTTLSNNRADTVKKMLVSLGMSAEAIETFGFGETDLAVPTGDNVVEPKNRRVEIVVN